MKKSELKEAIKAEIKSVLSEDITNKELKEGTWSSGTYNEIGRFIQDVKNLRDKYYDIVGSDDVFDGLDRAEEAAREMMINAPENRSDVTFDDIREDDDDMTPEEIEDFKLRQDVHRLKHTGRTLDDERKAAERKAAIREDEEPTSADLKKKDSIATISNKLQKLTAKMKKKAKEFKEAEGKAKDKIKDELKDMTAEKKKLEKSL